MGGRAAREPKNHGSRRESPVLEARRGLRNPGVESPQTKGASPWRIHSPTIPATPDAAAELDRLGDEIAELSAHLEAATARLLDLIREFDIRGRLEQRLPLLRRLAELARGARPGRGPRARPGGARPGHAARPGSGPRARGNLVRQGPRRDPRRHSRDRGAAAQRGARRHGRPRRADRARLAARGPPGRGPGVRAAARKPRASRPPGRGRHGRAPGPARAGSGSAGPAGAGSRARDAASTRASRWRIAWRTRRPSPSSRPTRWPCSRRRPSTTGSIPAPRASATRWWSTSTPPCWPTPSSRASPSWRTGRTFPRKRPAAWPATPAAWSCATTTRDASWRSAPGPGRFPRRCGERSTIGTRAAASRAADCRSARGITSATGPKAAPPRSRTSPCSVAGTTARSTRRATRSIESPTARSASGGRTAGPCPRSHLRPRVPDDPVQALRTEHVARGLRLHARTACPGWLGEPLDVGWAIDVLHPLAAGPSPVCR